MIKDGVRSLRVSTNHSKQLMRTRSSRTFTSEEKSVHVLDGGDRWFEGGEKVALRKQGCLSETLSSPDIHPQTPHVTPTTH